MEGSNITGTWRLLFSHSKGEFFLEPQPYKSNGRVAQFVEAGKIKRWDGYFREDDKISHMSAQIIFTENGSIYSTGGKDNMGSFNLLGESDARDCNYVKISYVHLDLGMSFGHYEILNVHF